MDMIFKYQEDYKKLTHTCPPKDYTSQNIEPVFRWVFDTIVDERNFTSQYHRKPKRFLDKDDFTKCKGMGLSMFINLNDSISRFNELKKAIGENIYSTLGKKIAQGLIKPTDGVNSSPEYLGHFTHHASNTTAYEKTFQIIQNLP